MTRGSFFAGFRGGPWACCLLIGDEISARMTSEELGVRSEGGGFAASIYGAMPKGLQWQVFRVSPAFPVSSSRAQPRDLSCTAVSIA